MGLGFLLAALAVGILRRRARFGAALLAAASLGLFLWAWPPFEAFFSGTLERRFAVGIPPADDVGAIVVLASNVYPRDASQPEATAGFGTYLRCRYAAWLYRNRKAVPVLASGGPSGSGAKTSVLADVMKVALEREGVPELAIWTERASLNTQQNAAFSAELLRAHGVRRILLVTEAVHMSRAAAVFRRQGLDVVPAPCAFRYIRFGGSWRDFLPSPAKMAQNEDTLHEWIGLAWYAARGWL